MKGWCTFLYGKCPEEIEQDGKRLCGLAERGEVFLCSAFVDANLKYDPPYFYMEEYD